MICGDTHGQLADFLWILKQNGEPGPGVAYLMNGDIADRGDYACEIFIIVLLYMLLYPDKASAPSPRLAPPRGSWAGVSSPGSPPVTSRGDSERGLGAARPDMVWSRGAHGSTAGRADSDSRSRSACVGRMPGAPAHSHARGQAVTAPIAGRPGSRTAAPAEG